MELDNELVLKHTLEIHSKYLTAVANDKNCSISNLKKDLSSDYEYIANKVPSILNIACSPNFDYNRLKYMLEMNSKVHNKEITEKEGSIQVGQVLVDDIVKPMLNKK